MATQVMQSINPWDGKINHEYPLLDSSTIQAKLEKAEETFVKWRSVPVQERAAKMLDLAEVLEKGKDKYARLMTIEMGKPITQAIAEIEKCIWLCNFYAEKGPQFLADKIVETDADKSYISYDPLGVVLAVMPWNYPFWQVFRFAVPGLVAGNVGVLKHASSVPACAVAIEEIFAEANFPENVFQTLLIKASQVRSVIENPIIKAVTLTGSKKAGESVASIAGAQIKKSVLELGGNNAVIVCADADLDKYIERIAWSRFQNTGQSCIAGKRFFVHRDIYGDFLERLLAIAGDYKSGDPLNVETEIGPMSSEKQAIGLEKQVQESLDNGARLVHGGKRENAYFQPTILENIKPGMPAYDDELFGPVAACMKVGSIEEAIQHSNNSEFGLGVSIYGKNIHAIEKHIALIEDGAVFINELVKSDPRLPFGGTKASGYGRELSFHGIQEFVNKKTVYVKA